VGQQPLGGRQQPAAPLTGEGRDVIISLPSGGDPHALLMPLGIEVGAGTPGCVTVLGLKARPGCRGAHPAARG
jgi:hypothetical protein